MYCYINSLRIKRKLNNIMFLSSRKFVELKTKTDVKTYRLRCSSGEANDIGALCVRFRSDTRLSMLDGDDRLILIVGVFGAVPFVF